MVDNTKEKKITIGLDVRGKNFNHKAKHAMTALKVQLSKHFRDKVCVISPLANEFIWAKGRVNKPPKVNLVSVEKNGKVYLFLDSKEDLKRKEEFLLNKKEGKDEKKDDNKARESNKVQSKESKEEPKTEHKNEVKSEPKKVEHKIEHKVEHTNTKKPELRMEKKDPRK